MGFRELSLFNEALLAKQTWRLLHNKNSLFCGVFKSRFFPNGSIMDANEGRGGSYAWKSILPAVPSKIKNFLWRACRNALPTNANLVRSCVLTNPRCCVYNNNEENVLHCLWSCPSLSTIWEEDPQWNFRTVTILTSFAQLLEYVFALNCSSELFTMVTWTVAKQGTLFPTRFPK